MTISNLIDNELSTLIIEKISTCDLNKLNECITVEYKIDLIEKLKQSFIKSSYKVNEKASDQVLLKNIFLNLNVDSIFIEIFNNLGDKTVSVEILVKNSVKKINKDNKNLQDSIDAYEKKLNTNTIIVVIIISSTIFFLVLLFSIINTNFIKNIKQQINRIVPQ